MLRTLLFSIAAMLLTVSLPAQAREVMTSDSCFAHIDSNLYVIADYMPRYTEEVPVGRISPAGYDVELCYPELQVLSNRELKSLRALQKSGVVLDDATLDNDGVILAPSPAPIAGLDLRQTMLVDRKKGILSISFCPIVRHEGVWKRMTSCQVKVCERPARRGAAPAETFDVPARWAENSVLASGKWAKVSVSKEGIYQLTSSDIQQMGFSDLSKIRVYGYGGRMQNEVLDFSPTDEDAHCSQAPDDLVEVPLHVTADGRLLFWAEGTVDYKWSKGSREYSHIPNTYSTYSAYFVTESNDPRSAVSQLPVSSTEGSTVVTDVPYVTVYEKDESSWYPGGRHMFENQDFSSVSTQSFRLATPGLNLNAVGTKKIEVSVGASSSLSTTKLNVKINGNNLGTASVPTIIPENEEAVVGISSFTNLSALSATEGNIFQLTANSSNKARLDYIRVNYPRHLQLEGAPYSFSPQSDAPVTLRVAGANAHTHLWRIGQKGSPTAEVPTRINDQGELEGVVSAGHRRYVFFDDSRAYEAPTYMGSVANQNLHADRDIDYVIIVPANGQLVAQAERLGELHKQHDGYSYKVVRADQLYNEFSSGTPDASAYRRYLKMLYDRAGDDDKAMPHFCLFMGKSSWDNRLLTEENKGQQSDNHLLAYEVNNTASPKSVGSVNAYVTDDFFGLLDDMEGTSIGSERLDVALGRFVCNNEADAKRLVDKVEQYINNVDPGSWKNNVVFLADCGDRNGHMNDSERVVDVINKVAPNLDVQKVYWDRYTWTSSATGYTFPQATARIRQLMTEGALLFNYSGHGSPNIISHYKLLQTPDFSEALSPHLAVWVLASCEIYPFDSGEENLAERSLYVADGGSIAFICATRAVYADRNNLFNRSYCNYVLSRDEDGRTLTLGEALRRTKTTLVDNGTDKTINKLKYVCFGDPALRISLPTGKVVLDAINDSPINSTTLETLTAGSAVKFSGHVCKMNTDELDETFDGNVSAVVYDCIEEVICKNNLNEKDLPSPMQYEERSKNIFRGQTKAQNGRFEFIISIPRDISYSNNAGRISFYAVSSDRTTEYNGFSESFCLNGTAAMEEPDTKGPEVVAYINSIDNPDYTITDENPVLIADIFDEYGINCSGVSLGHDIELILDGNTTQIINLNSAFSYDFGSYQRGQLVYEMKDVPRGQHTAQLRVWDINNNATISDVHFIVRSQNAGPGKNGYVTATKNPASTDTRFITYFPADADAEGLVCFEVYDTRGRCVYKESVSVAPGSSSSSHTWDLCGNDHSPLPAGIYFYRTVINTSNGQQTTDAQKLIITRP